MTEIPIRRSRLESSLEALYAASTCCAVAAIFSILWSRYLIDNGPFPKVMKARFLELYDSPYGIFPFGTFNSYGTLRSVLYITFFSWLIKKFGANWRFRAFSRLEDHLRRRGRTFPPMFPSQGGTDWPTWGLLYGYMGIVYCISIVICIMLAYQDTLACYTRQLRYSVDVVAYEPCDSIGISTPEFPICKKARGWLFVVQMASLVFAVVPATVHGLHFAITVHQIYAAFALLNRHLETIRAKRPEIDAELNALEAQDRLLAAGMKQENGLEISFRSKVEARTDERKTEMGKQFEQVKLQ